MAISTIDSLGPTVIIESYSATYSNSVKAARSLSASNLRITEKPGYTIGAILRWYSGNSGEDVAQVKGVTSGTVMIIKDSTQSAVTDQTAYIRIMWVRNDSIRVEA